MDRSASMAFLCGNASLPYHVKPQVSVAAGGNNRVLGLKNCRKMARKVEACDSIRVLFLGYGEKRRSILSTLVSRRLKDLSVSFVASPLAGGK